MVMNDSNSGFNEQGTNGKSVQGGINPWYNKYNSNMCPSNQGNLLGNSGNKDTHHKRTRMMGTQKYPRESCYHHIKCTTATFLAAFMWRRPLNSVALAITTHRKPEGVSDVTSTQALAWMIDTCRRRMVQKELYNGRELCSTQKPYLYPIVMDLYDRTPPRMVDSFCYTSFTLAWSTSKYILAVVQLIKT